MMFEMHLLKIIKRSVFQQDFLLVFLMFTLIPHLPSRQHKNSHSFLASKMFILSSTNVIKKREEFFWFFHLNSTKKCLTFVQDLSFVQTIINSNAPTVYFTCQKKVNYENRRVERQEMGIKEMTPKNISLNCRFICLNLREIKSMKDGKFPSQENFIESHYDKNPNFVQKLYFDEKLPHF